MEPPRSRLTTRPLFSHTDTPIPKRMPSKDKYAQIVSKAKMNTEGEYIQKQRLCTRSKIFKLIIAGGGGLLGPNSGPEGWMGLSVPSVAVRYHGAKEGIRKAGGRGNNAPVEQAKWSVRQKNNTERKNQNLDVGTSFTTAP